MYANGAAGLGHFDDADAVGVEFLDHLVVHGSRAVHDGGTVDVQEERRDGLVVHDQQSAIARGGAVGSAGAHAEVVDGVVMIAGAQRMRRAGFRAVVRVIGDTGGDRIAQPEEHAGRVAGRDHDGVGQALADRGEVEPQLRRRRRGNVVVGARHEAAAEERAGRQAHGAFEQRAPAHSRVEDARERGIAGRIGVVVVDVGEKGGAGLGRHGGLPVGKWPETRGERTGPSYGPRFAAS